MSLVHHPMRWALTAIFALALALVASAPRHASAQSPEIALQSGYITVSANTGDIVEFLILINSTSASEETATASISFPPGTTYVDNYPQPGPYCNYVYVTPQSGGAVDVQFVVPAGGGCAHVIQVRFSKAGNYGPGDTTWSVDTPDTNGVDAALINPNVTIIAVAPPVPLFCEQTPDMAVSPQYIELAPGGRATVDITMRNLCADAPTVPGDLLVSFSDGLTVVDATNGMTGNGNRATLSAFALNPGETRSWSVTVEAAAELAAAPVHITEHYVGGRVMSRIDGVFITPAPIPAPVVEAAPVVVAPVVVAPVAPAAPVTLPNTAGEASGMLPQLLTALAAAGAGLALRRRS